MAVCGYCARWSITTDYFFFWVVKLGENAFEQNKKNAVTDGGRRRSALLSLNEISVDLVLFAIKLSELN